MNWLDNLLKILPLDKISDALGNLVIWWSNMVGDVPAEQLPMYAYIGGSIIVLLLWLIIARILPKPLGGITWVMLFAVLFAPGTALGDPTMVAPASISVVYAIMMKDFSGAIANALPILVVMVAGFFIGFIWQLLRGAIESSMQKSRQQAQQDANAQIQLATGNYLADSTLADHTNETVMNSSLPADKKSSGKKLPFKKSSDNNLAGRRADNDMATKMDKSAAVKNAVANHLSKVKKK